MTEKNTTEKDQSANFRLLTAAWWALLVRAAVALLFGLLALLVPGVGLLLLVTLWGAYALVDGVFNVVFAARAARKDTRRGWMLFEGIVSVFAGLTALVWPGITALILLAVIGAWAVLTGIAEIVAAIRLRRVLSGDWLLIVSGILSVALGVLLFVNPRAGVTALVWMVGAYSLAFGAVLLGLALRLNHWRRSKTLRAFG